MKSFRCALKFPTQFNEAKKWHYSPWIEAVSITAVVKARENLSRTAIIGRITAWLRVSVWHSLHGSPVALLIRRYIQRSDRRSKRWMGVKIYTWEWEETPDHGCCIRKTKGVSLTLTVGNVVFPLGKAKGTKGLWMQGKSCSTHFSNEMGEGGQKDQSEREGLQGGEEFLRDCFQSF